jgi:hypothetical protein
LDTSFIYLERRTFGSYRNHNKGGNNIKILEIVKFAVRYLGAPIFEPCVCILMHASLKTLMRILE